MLEEALPAVEAVEHHRTGRPGLRLPCRAASVATELTRPHMSGIRQTLPYWPYTVPDDLANQLDDCTEAGTVHHPK